jgi:azobenzene reductase
MEVAILLGSVRKGRQSHKVAYYLQHLLEKRNLGTELIDLSEDSLPIFGEQSVQSVQVDKVIRDIGERLGRADAIVLVTPEYHGSFSGALKNALDYYWEEFQKKPIGVVTVSAGRMGGINASTQLQHVILSLGGYPLPLKLLVPEVQTAFDTGLLPTRDGIAKSAIKFLDEFTWFAEAITEKKQSTVPF